MAGRELKEIEGTDNRESWHEQRRKGIGGSDVPVIILGEYFGKTVQDLFFEKTNGSGENIDGPDIRRGKRQEPIAAMVYEEITGQKVRRINKVLQHPEHSFMLANIDREIVGEDAILEIKCPRHMTFRKWQREGVPEGPLLQGQHYLAVRGRGKVVFGIFCAEIDEMMIVPIERDNELIDLIINKEGEFWEFVKAKELPREFKPAQIDLPPVGGADLIKLDTPEWAQATMDLREARELKTEAEAIEATAKAKVQELMGDHAIAEGANCRIYWQTQKGRESFNKKELQKDHPDIYSQYVKQGNPFRVFKPYFLKGGVE